MKLYRIKFALWRMPTMTCNNGPERVADLDVWAKGRSIAEAIPRAEGRANSLLAEGVEARVISSKVEVEDVKEAERRLYSDG